MLTPAIEEYINKKIGSLEKFFSDSSNALCEVEVGKSTEHHKSGEIYRAEVNISLPGMPQVFAVAHESQLYAAIDIVKEETEREILSKKNKKTALFRKGAAKIKNIIKSLNFKKR